MNPPVFLPATLTPLYDAWLGELLPAPIPAERNATCDDCAMCAQPDGDGTDAHYFDPRGKCCTYSPSLANFLVGGILGDPDALARDAVERRIADRADVTPLGVLAPAREVLVYDNLEAGAFGRSVSLVCRYYQPVSGRCGVWRHRNGICSTWFCKHVRGATGLAFWTALTGLLVTVEDGLAKWCALELGLEPERVLGLVEKATTRAHRLGPDTLDGHPSPEQHERAWGRWAGRESEFYVGCARLVAGLRWPDVLRIGGTDVRLRAGAVGAAFERLTSDVLPPAVRVGSFGVVRIAADKVVVNTYRATDPLALPRRLVDALHHFDGRSPREAIGAIARGGLALQPSVVRKLLDFGVLTGVEEAGSRGAREETRP